MAEPFMSEIRLMSFNYAPKGWALCNGQVLPVSQNSGLASLLKDTFGGDGISTFALPDLRGRTPIHVGNGHALGDAGGEESHLLSTGEMPEHVHGVSASSVATNGSAQPLGNFLGGGNNAYHSPNGNVTALRPDTVTPTGGALAHMNMQPFLTLNFCIALQGIYPSAN